MKLAHPFYRLPIEFDAERLAAEVAALGEGVWQPHPQGFAGNSALPLLSVGGDPQNDSPAGPVGPTPHLARCPYLQQVLAALQTPLGRTRLMRIAGQSEASVHADTNYYWAERVRVHVPIVTQPGVRFQCGDAEVFMAAGECWIFDNWRRHNVINPNDRPRIHLVADTTGSSVFWDMVGRGQPMPSDAPELGRRRIAFAPGVVPTLQTEASNFPVVMAPAEARRLIHRLSSELDELPSAATKDALKTLLEDFLVRWSALWSRFADGAAGWALYEADLRRFAGELGALDRGLVLSNGVDAINAVRHWLVDAAVNPALAGITPRRSSGGRFDRPVFIVAAPRSGSTLLFETLSRARGVYTVGGESHDVFESDPALSPSSREFGSNRLTSTDATQATVTGLQRRFAELLRDRDGRPPAGEAPVRLLEKTPKNALRISFLRAAFPDARFIYLYREPRQNLASIIEAWRSEKFVTYPRLPGWTGLLQWSLLLVPEWQALRGRSIAEVAAAQWRAAHDFILSDLASLPSDRWTTIRYEALITNPDDEIARLCRFADWAWDQPRQSALPLARHALTPPNPNKWRQHAAVIEPLLPGLADIVARAERVCPATGPAETPIPSPPAPPPVRTAHALSSVHTASFAMLLRELHASVWVTTYQAGKLVVLRADGEQLNTHFRSIPKPMGLVLTRDRCIIGTEVEIREFRNVPAVAKRLAPAGKHDACFLPRSSHVTGDVLVHELGLAGSELLFVNTRFSCLCTIDPDHSFVPRWRPPFISSLTPDDRCHLNGLAIVDGAARYVTALGESDEARGWRAKKRDGGVVIDVAKNAVIARGLSMPHSPRWHDGQLWVLNSGEGGLGVIDPNSGRYQQVARLPGFTRGLDFIGRYAFVGLSQVRENATFGDIAIAELPVGERACGVWVVDTQTGKLIGFTKFDDGVQEIFAVQIGAQLVFPDIMTDDLELISSSFVLPDAALAVVPESLKK